MLRLCRDPLPREFDECKHVDKVFTAPLVLCPLEALTLATVCFRKLFHSNGQTVALGGTPALQAFWVGQEFKLLSDPEPATGNTGQTLVLATSGAIGPLSCQKAWKHRRRCTFNRRYWIFAPPR